MTAAMFQLVRHIDKSGVSGTGPVGTVVEFDSGITVLHWDTATPSVAVHTDSRHIEQLHGHQGATTLVPMETRLEKAYRRVMPYLLEGGINPIKVGPHVDHPDRLHLVFMPGDETAWRRWVTLLEGSTFAAVHVERDGETEHRWVSPDGDLWLSYWTTDLSAEQLLAGERYEEDPLEIFDREDR